MNNILILTFLANIYNIDPKLVISVAKVESNLTHHVVSNKGAYGYMQLKPSSFPNYNVKDEVTNLFLGVKYLSEMRKICKYKDNHLYILCYNRGPTGVNNVTSPYNDNYYKKVMREYKKL